MHEDVPKPEAAQGKQNEIQVPALDRSSSPFFPSARKMMQNEIKIVPESKARTVLVKSVIDFKGRSLVCLRFTEVNKDLRLIAATSQVIRPFLEHPNCIYPVEVIVARALAADTEEDEDSKAKAKRILTAMSKTIRTLRKS